MIKNEDPYKNLKEELINVFGRKITEIELIVSIPKDVVHKIFSLDEVQNLIGIPNIELEVKTVYGQKDESINITYKAFPEAEENENT